MVIPAPISRFKSEIARNFLGRLNDLPSDELSSREVHAIHAYIFREIGVSQRAGKLEKPEAARQRCWWVSIIIS